MKHDLSRRGFLQGAAALGLATQGRALGLPWPQAKGKTPSATRSVVVVFLRGGADFLNMVIPRGDSQYELKRPGIGVPADKIVALDSDWGLHPALAPLLPLYREERFLPIINAGSPHETRSHFDAEDFMGFAAPGDRTVHDGWLNRYLSSTAGAESNDFRALGMQRLLPIALRGRFPVLAVPDEFDKQRSSDVLDYFERFYGADDKGESSDEDRQGQGEMDRRREKEAELDVVQSGKVTIETLRRFREIIAKSDKVEAAYPQSEFGEGMKRIAQVLQSGEGLEAAGIDIGGWDHHANQGGVDGAQARKLLDFSQTIAAFRAHLGDAFDNTLVIVMTEFGRTVMENGSGGTDHGHGSGLLLFGGGLKGGEVFGDWSGLKTEQLYEARDLPVTTDFRDVFNTVLRDHLDFKAPKEFFPDFKPKRLRLFA